MSLLGGLIRGWDEFKEEWAWMTRAEWAENLKSRMPERFADKIINNMEAAHQSFYNYNYDNDMSRRKRKGKIKQQHTTTVSTTKSDTPTRTAVKHKWEITFPKPEKGQEQLTSENSKMFRLGDCMYVEHGGHDMRLTNESIKMGDIFWSPALLAAMMADAEAEKEKDAAQAKAASQP